MVFGLFTRKAQARSTSPPSTATNPPPSTTTHIPSSSTYSPLPSLSPAPLPPPSLSPPPLDPSDTTHLHDLVLAVPSKTLHTYILDHLRPNSNLDIDLTILAALKIFFAALTPPPSLHCVRCHTDYFEVDNGDRSCMVPHDDDSALVERVGRSASARRLSGAFVDEGGTVYETLWGCCGKTVPGDGDMGPPDGWCYEGKHTTDAKRARFRADSTLHDDKLTSCLRLNCHGVRDHLPGRSPSRRARKRPRKPLAGSSSGDGASSDDDAENSIADHQHPSKRQKSESTRGSVRGSGRGRAPRSQAKSKGTTKPMEKGDENAAPGSADADGDEQMSVVEPAPPPPPPRKGRPRAKTVGAAIVTSDTDAPMTRSRSRSRIRSQSIARVAPKTPHSKSRAAVRGRQVDDGEPTDSAREDGEDVKKTPGRKRKAVK